MMRVTGFLVVIAAALLFLLPLMWQEQSQNNQIEAQEEELVRTVGKNTFEVTFETSHPDEESVADIFWMKRAAQVAKDSDIPYFNVLEQEIGHVYSEEFDRELSVVSGVIELEPDPMKAEYDAREILSLVLNEYPGP
jgi:outer membrane biogenesis lipoprotein LolB